MIGLTFSIELIALGVGIALLMLAEQSKKAMTDITRIAGYFISIAAVIVLLYTGAGFISGGERSNIHQEYRSDMMNKSMHSDRDDPRNNKQNNMQHSSDMRLEQNTNFDQNMNPNQNMSSGENMKSGQNIKQKRRVQAIENSGN